MRLRVVTSSQDVKTSYAKMNDYCSSDENLKILKLYILFNHRRHFTVLIVYFFMTLLNNCNNYVFYDFFSQLYVYLYHCI